MPADRDPWLRFQADAALHFLDTLKRVALELDRRGVGLTDDEVLAMMTDLNEQVWLVVEALRTPRVD